MSVCFRDECSRARRHTHTHTCSGFSENNWESTANGLPSAAINIDEDDWIEPFANDGNYLWFTFGVCETCNAFSLRQCSRLLLASLSISRSTRRQALMTLIIAYCRYATTNYENLWNSQFTRTLLLAQIASKQIYMYGMNKQARNGKREREMGMEMNVCMCEHDSSRVEHSICIFGAIALQTNCKRTNEYLSVDVVDSVSCRCKRAFEWILSVHVGLFYLFCWILCIVDVAIAAVFSFRCRCVYARLCSNTRNKANING